MHTATGHSKAMLGSKVKGTSAYNSSGDKIGHVEDVVLGFGGFLGIGEKYH